MHCPVEALNSTHQLSRNSFGVQTSGGGGSVSIGKRISGYWGKAAEKLMGFKPAICSVQPPLLSSWLSFAGLGFSIEPTTGCMYSLGCVGTSNRGDAAVTAG